MTRQGPGALTADGGPDVRLGLRANLGQFLLLAVVNFFVGGMVGTERTVTPLVGAEQFHLGELAIAAFVVVFGLTKALTNAAGGALTGRYSRKAILVAGWVIGLPVPFMLAWGPSWAWVIAANVLLGVNQGLTWSMTVNMKIDLIGPARRGMALGINETAGYLGVAVTALATGYLATGFGLRPAPELLGAAYAVAGLALSVLAVRDTAPWAAAEARQHPRPGRAAPAVPRDLRAGLLDRPHPGRGQPGRAGQQPQRRPGLGRAPGPAGRPRRVGHRGRLHQGAVPVHVGRRDDRHRPPRRPHRPQAPHRGRDAHPGRRAGRHHRRDLPRPGRRAGRSLPPRRRHLPGLPHPARRGQRRRPPRLAGTGLGVYRLWRDSGYAIGALIGGITAAIASLDAAIGVAAILTAASGLLAWAFMTETHPRPAADSGSAGEPPLPTRAAA